MRLWEPFISAYLFLSIELKYSLPLQFHHFYPFSPKMFAISIFLTIKYLNEDYPPKDNYFFLLNQVSKLIQRLLTDTLKILT